MAALSIGHSFHTKRSSTQQLAHHHYHYHNKNSRFLVQISCQNRVRLHSTIMKIKKEKDKEEMEESLVLKLMVSAEKVGRKLKESLSPKRKGDWKDLLLMSLSFAIYVYISQKLVCAYCAWTSMFKQPW